MNTKDLCEIYKEQSTTNHMNNRYLKNQNKRPDDTVIFAPTQN